MSNLVTNVYENDIIGLLPEIFFSNSIVVLLVLGVVYDRYIISMGVSVGEVLRKQALIVTFFTVCLYLNQYGVDMYLLNYQVEKNELVIFLLLLIFTGLGVCLVMSKEYMKLDNLDEYEYILLMLLSTLGIIVMLTANDLLAVYLGVELQSLALYILATFKQESSYSTEAGF